MARKDFRTFSQLFERMGEDVSKGWNDAMSQILPDISEEGRRSIEGFYRDTDLEEQFGGEDRLYPAPIDNPGGMGFDKYENPEYARAYDEQVRNDFMSALGTPVRAAQRMFNGAFNPTENIAPPRDEDYEFTGPPTAETQAALIKQANLQNLSKQYESKAFAQMAEPVEPGISKDEMDKAAVNQSNAAAKLLDMAVNLRNQSSPNSAVYAANEAGIMRGDGSELREPSKGSYQKIKMKFPEGNSFGSPESLVTDYGIPLPKAKLIAQYAQLPGVQKESVLQLIMGVAGTAQSRGQQVMDALGNIGKKAADSTEAKQAAILQLQYQGYSDEEIANIFTDRSKAKK